LDDDTNALIEQQLFRLLRRTNAIHVSTSTGEVDLERSSYGILCLLADEGPQRLGAIATSFRLDPSTVTRQVQTVVNLGMARKDPDPKDRRATVLSLTDLGREAVNDARTYRRQMLHGILGSWTEDERQQLLDSLSRFNASIDKVAEEPAPRR
jgi:DNA-binding MarR family transcriptional regulator